jgi:opacity protein-like surface antigen
LRPLLPYRIQDAEQEEFAMKRILFATTLLALACATPAYAGSAGTVLFGIDYAYGSFTGGASPANVLIRGGYYFTDNIAGEVHVLTAGTTDSGIKVDHAYAAFVRGEFAVSQSINLYGLLGYGSGDVSGAATRSNSSPAYGVGAEIGIGDNVGIDVAYIQYFNANNQSLSDVTAGMTYKF